MRKDAGAPDHLVAVLGIDAQCHGHLHSLVEPGGRQLLYEPHGILERVLDSAIDLALRLCEALADPAHQSVTSSPMLLAVPLTIITAASSEAALRSAIFVRAISRT